MSDKQSRETVDPETAIARLNLRFAERYTAIELESCEAKLRVNRTDVERARTLLERDGVALQNERTLRTIYEAKLKLLDLQTANEELRRQLVRKELEDHE